MKIVSSFPRLGLPTANRCFALVMWMLCSSAAVMSQPQFVKNIAHESHSFVAANGMTYFANADSLFVVNSSTVTFVKKLNETIAGISEVTIGNKVFITTRISATQRALWVSSGTSSSTVKVGTYVNVFPHIAFNNELYLTVDDGVHGIELWKLSASNQLTMLKDINPGINSSYGNSAAVSNGLLYFIADDGTGRDLWKTDGSTAGTVKAVDMPFDSFYELTDVNGTIFFERDSLIEWDYSYLVELWKTQGTPGTTQMIKSFGVDYMYHHLEHLTSFNGKLYFVRYYNIPDIDLMVSDGTEAGTYVAGRQIARDGTITELETIDKYVVYYGETQSYPNPIEKYDTQVPGHSLVHQLNYMYGQGWDMRYVDLTVAGDRMFFVDHATGPAEYPADDEISMLFESKPGYTPETTQSLRELYDFPYSATRNLTAVGKDNDIVFTTSNSGVTKLWYYDPDNLGCDGVGGLTRELWTNVSGNRVSQIPLNTPPASVETVTSFQGPTNAGNNYGARYSGYLCVPVTGNYKFFIASDDYSELYLSSTSSPANKQRIAYVHGATKAGEYTKYPSQQSALIQLTAGTKYYIEALHKEGGTYDHLKVAMQYPNGTMENPIMGTHLIPLQGNELPQVAITSPADGAEVDANTNLTIRAEASDPDGSIAKVEFFRVHEQYGEDKLGVDFEPPYEATWYYTYEGEYTLIAKAYDNNNGVATASINVTVIGCNATGQILREVWTNVKGQPVSYIPVNTTPTFTEYLTSLEGPTNAGDTYGARIRGYLCAPMDGDYTFYISSDDHSELWLSTGSDPANKVKIAYVFGSTLKRQWNKYPSQQSVKISLRRGVRYYVEVLHKENLGYDHVSVGWIHPNGTAEMPIPGSRLSPFETSSSAATQMVADNGSAREMQADENGLVQLTPNPVKDGRVTVKSQGLVFGAGATMRVQVLSLTGEVVYTTDLECGSGCETVDVNLSNDVKPGIYILKGSTGGQQFLKRLVVE